MPNDTLQTFQDFFARMMLIDQQVQAMPDEDTPLGQLTRAFFENNWIACRDGLLSRTNKIRIEPEPLPAPSIFHFQIDCRYKRRFAPNAPIEIAPGPLRGRILYRANLFEDTAGPTIAVLIDRRLGYLHPNYSRERGFLCIGDQSQLPPGPVPLDRLLADHIYPIVTYQNRRPMHPADLEAARYFALDPEAMMGLEHPDPLY